MTIFELTMIGLAVESILYLLLVVVTLRRGNLQERASRMLILYAAVSSLWAMEQLAWHVGWLDLLGINAYLLVRIPLYGLILLAMLFLHLTRAFLRLPGQGWGWTVLGLAWIVVLALLDSNVLALPNAMWMARGWGLSRLMFTFGLAVAGWGLFTLATLVLIVQIFRRTRLPLHRNRLTYWLIAWGFLLIGDILFWAGQPVIGGDIHLLGVLIVAYVVIVHRLPDVRQTLRRAASYLLITLLSVVTYTAGFTIVHYFFQNLPGYNPIWAGAFVALILAVLFDPLLSLVQKLVTRFFSKGGYDPGLLISEYSLSISNIVSLERLAAVMVGLIGEAMEIQRGMLFIVDFKREVDGNKAYDLQGIKGLGPDVPPQGILLADSPVTYHLREKRQPLTQYDVDLLPDFEELDEGERAWLSSLEMDVYVPIHAQASWIGLLALGSKLSGDRYFDQDLTLLNTLADQTAVALENARLVDDLVRLNQDLQDTYMALARANRQLQEMDKLKSAFIGVITHELRSPFANIAFSLQIFTRYGLENLTGEQREQLMQLTTNLQSAKTMVDNLVTFATFLSKQGELTLSQVDFRTVLRETLLPLRAMIEGKEHMLRIIVPQDLPPLCGDQDRLSDATHHLVHNAIKFTATGGTIWIRVYTENSALHFEVNDNGVGIPADKLPILWEGFAQMADPLQRGVEGLGLGLALVKYIIGAHGGRVWAKSKVGQGSTFGFAIPLEGPGDVTTGSRF